MSMPTCTYEAGEAGYGVACRTAAKMVETRLHDALIIEGLYCHAWTVVSQCDAVVFIHDSHDRLVIVNRIRRDVELRGYSPGESYERCVSQVCPGLTNLSGRCRRSIVPTPISTRFATNAPFSGSPILTGRPGPARLNEDGP